MVRYSGRHVAIGLKAGRGLPKVALRRCGAFTQQTRIDCSIASRYQSKGIAPHSAPVSSRFDLIVVDLQNSLSYSKLTYSMTLVQAQVEVLPKGNWACVLQCTEHSMDLEYDIRRKRREHVWRQDKATHVFSCLICSGTRKCGGN